MMGSDWKVICVTVLVMWLFSGIQSYPPGHSPAIKDAENVDKHWEPQNVRTAVSGLASSLKSRSQFQSFWFPLFLL